MVETERQDEVTSSMVDSTSYSPLLQCFAGRAGSEGEGKAGGLLRLCICGARDGAFGFKVTSIRGSEKG